MSQPQDPGIELETLFPDMRLREIGGESISLSPFRVRQLARAGPALRRIKARVGDRNELVALVTRCSDELITIAAIAVKKPEPWVANLPALEFLAIALDVVELNADLLCPPRRAPRLRRPGDDLEQPGRWADALHFLIEHGHRNPGDYTLRQVKAYIDAAVRADARKRRAMVCDLRAAQVEAKDFSKYLNGLAPKE